MENRARSVVVRASLHYTSAENRAPSAVFRAEKCPFFLIIIIYKFLLFKKFFHFLYLILRYDYKITFIIKCNRLCKLQTQKFHEQSREVTYS